MPPKARTPAPIDRPLSRAYLREFSGWSTAYPPGVSEPTSLRIMENVQINRDGSVRVRPGLRYLSYASEGQAYPDDVVGSHEAFFLNDGSKAYLFAVREVDNTVGFRVLVPSLSGTVVKELTDAGIDFTVGEELNFTEDTTYVKYLQIDNKIFALSNAGEPMRLFYVGASKSAKKLSSIEKPEWTVADKLSVVQPEAAWITSGVPTSVRTNLLPNPNIETGVNDWYPVGYTALSRSADAGAQDGTYAMRLESTPERTNLVPYPLKGPVTSVAGWAAGSNAEVFDAYTGYARLSVAAIAGRRAYANSPYFDGIVAGNWYTISYDLVRGSTAADPRLLVRFFAANGALLSEQEADVPDVDHRVVINALAPAGAVAMQFYPSVTNTQGNVPTSILFRNVVVCPYGQSAAYFDGDSGANYFWTGTTGASASVYHPPKDIQAWSGEIPVTAGETYTGSSYVKAGSTVRQSYLSTVWYDSRGAVTNIDADAAANDSAASWTRFDLAAAAPATTTKARYVVTFLAVPRGEYHYVDASMFELAGAVGTYFDGSTTSTSTSLHAWSGTAHGSTSTETALSAPGAAPGAETKTANTLISTGTNDYNFGFFYVFANEVGESAASQVTVVKTQRGWSEWKWETANASGEPSGTGTADPLLCADQLVAIVPETVFDQALDQGATSWKLYMLTWSDQDPVPVSAVKIAEKQLTADSLYGAAGWLQATPQQADASAETSGLPNLTTRFNYSNPSRGGNGLVAADRMILVNDPTAQAVIRWSSNLQGSYTDFTANKGGGYKTLTSGNLYVPAAVKLWQNPQSVDTLTILCMGVDGYSTGYYMAPAQVAQQSEAVNVMGFEETTATPGTVSPYGCEVLNNALYHPLDEQLMKSTATNYNINHSSMTDAIQDVWRKLLSKNHIVSSFHDNRLYYLVHNPAGEELEQGCWGNEVWVLDAAQKQGTWSRWLVQGQSLRKIELGGKVLMSVTRPDGIFYFDEDYSSDDYVLVDGEDNLVPANDASGETDASGWVGNTLFGSYSGVPTISSSAVHAFHGSKSILLTWPTSANGAWGGLVDSVPGLVVGNTYTASVYVYVPAGSPDVRLEVAFQGQSASTSVKDAWVRLSVTWVAVSTDAFPGVSCAGSAAGQLCYVDGLMLNEGDTAGPFVIGHAAGAVSTRSIPWQLETNTQGANRAHDAWAHLQQANVHVGFFQGQMRYGVRGHDMHGKPVNISKIIRDTDTPGTEAYDLEDFLEIKRDMKEWFFYASSVTDDDDVVQPSAGQISLVQYRYTPTSVNVGYAFGSVETFEYGRSGNSVDQRTVDNGVPMPYIDTSRP